jgi:hypothetical protein
VTYASDCQLLRDLAARTWSDIRDGEMTGVAIGEESITDYLLLDLHRHSAHPSYLRKWSRWVEGRSTGADWDWWFVRPDLSAGVGLRIQAKRIDLASQTFNELGHKNQHGFQIDMLESSAATAGMHPLYCLYLASDRPPTTGRSACGSYLLGDSPDGWTGDPLHVYGCSVLGTRAAKSAIEAKDARLEPLWPFLLPWSCLVCCQGLGTDLIERVDAGARHVYGSPPRGPGIELPALAFGDEPVSRSLITDNLPPEVLTLVRSEGTERVANPPDVGATLVTVASDMGDG